MRTVAGAGAVPADLTQEIMLVGAGQLQVLAVEREAARSERWRRRPAALLPWRWGCPGGRDRTGREQTVCGSFQKDAALRTPGLHP